MGYTFFLALLLVALTCATDPCNLSVKDSLNANITNVQQLITAKAPDCPDLYLTLDTNETYDEDRTKERWIYLGLTEYVSPINLYLKPGGNNTGYSTVTFFFNGYFTSVTLTGFKFSVPSYQLSSRSPLRVHSCLFKEGKGISLATFTTPLVVTDSEFEYLNLSQPTNCAISSSRSDSTNITRCIFRHNVVRNAIVFANLLVASNNHFENNTLIGDSKAGGVINALRHLVLNNNTFLSNSYTGANGGGAAVFASNSLLAVGNLFENNKVFDNTSYAGALAIIGNGELYGNTFRNNSAGATGGAVIQIDDGSTLTLGAGNQFIGNVVPDKSWGGALFVRGFLNITHPDNNFTGNYAGGAGAVYFGKSSTIRGNFLNNSCLLKGGAISAGPTQWDNDIKLYIDQAKFEGNSAVAGTGGAIDTASEIIFLSSNVEFNDNFAFYTGAAILSFHTNTSIKGTYRRNTAQYAGAILGYNNTLTVSDAYFEANSATELRGGAITSTKGFVLLSGNNTFVGNWAKFGGGAVYVGRFVSASALEADIAKAILASPIPNILGKDYGIKDKAEFLADQWSFGALGSYSFKDNYVLSNSTGLYWGGGAVLAGGLGTVACGPTGTFEGNRCPSWGGAIAGNRVVVSGVTFRNNSATFGGAIYASSYQSPDHVVENNVFDNNQASGLAQAVYIKGTYSTSNNVFTNNLAGTGKGSISVVDNATLTLSGDTFTNSNIYLETNTSTVIKGSVQVTLVCSNPSLAPYGPNGQYRCVPKSVIPTSTSTSSSSSSSSSLSRSSSSSTATDSTESSSESGTETSSESGTETLPSNNTNTKTDSILTKGSGSALTVSFAILAAALSLLL